MSQPRRRRSPVVPAVAAVLGAVALAAVLWPRGEGVPPAPAPAAAPAVAPVTARPGPAAPAVASPPVPPSPPVRLEIPGIGIRAKVLSLGLNPDGTLEVPPLSKAEQTGWYNRGSAPGLPGPTVIAGHVDSARGPAVFYRLGALKRGDRARVVRADGKVATYEIDAIESVPKDAFPTDRVYGAVPHPALRLITCGGAFDRATGHYENNTIAYAHLLSLH
ncbi:class F sortase [Bailinhaonella thermotolerans]|uniref:Class F sortase n=1 Tax=Bailinhaonella thermotolerans TaxID=1070861 RepID=A0A3A4AQQ1_9ACTN|nr:class F sortase [Bailinhaonella thermotolerans]RJL21741.1 class F sortase [Bailinhaonella thermotolerans]